MSFTPLYRWKCAKVYYNNIIFQLFKGVFYHCEGPDQETVKNKTQCLELSGNGNKWVNHKYNFDNLGQALMSLFVLSSKDGWVNIMYSGLDAVGIDQQVGNLIKLTLVYLYKDYIQIKLNKLGNF